MIEEQVIADPKPKIPRPEFAAKIKAKYPQYKHIADEELIDKIVAKYPAYADTVEPLKKKDEASPTTGIPFENQPETSLHLPGEVDLGQPLPQAPAFDEEADKAKTLADLDQQAKQQQADLFKTSTPEQQSLDYYKAKRDERLLRENQGIDPKTPEFDPMVTFLKSAWNTLAYQLPSGIAAGLAASSRTSKANPENYDQQHLAQQEAKTDEVKGDLLKWAEQRQGEGAEITSNLVSSLDKIHDPIDILNWLSYAGGQAAGQIPASIASFGATSIGQEVGSIYLESVQKIARDKKLTIDEVIQQDLDKPALALAYGTVAGALDYLGAKNATGGLGKEVLKKSLQSRALGIVKSPAVVEAGTEYAQQWVEQIGASQAAGDEFGKTWDLANTDQAARDRIESLAQGGVGGQGAHIVTQTLTKQQNHALPIRKSEAVPLDEASGGSQEVGPRISGPGTQEPPNAQGGQQTGVPVQPKEEKTVTNEKTKPKATGKRKRAKVPKVVKEQPTPISGEEKKEGQVPDIIPKDLKKKGEPVSSNDDAKSRFSAGERIFAFHEQGETPVELFSVEKMDNFSSDQLLAYPKEETKQITPKDIHAAAKEAGIDYESKDFMNKSKELTGKEHLDDMAPEELSKVKDYVQSKKTVDERDQKIKEASKPNIKLTFVSPKDLVKSSDPVGTKEKQDGIKDQYKELRKLIDCLHG